MATNQEHLASIIEQANELRQWPEDELGPVREDLKEIDNLVDNALAIMKGD